MGTWIFSSSAPNISHIFLRLPVTHFRSCAKILPYVAPTWRFASGVLKNSFQKDWLESMTMCLLINKLDFFHLWIGICMYLCIYLCLCSSYLLIQLFWFIQITYLLIGFRLLWMYAFIILIVYPLYLCTLFNPLSTCFTLLSLLDSFITAWSIGSIFDLFIPMFIICLSIALIETVVAASMAQCKVAINYVAAQKQTYTTNMLHIHINTYSYTHAMLIYIIHYNILNIWTHMNHNTINTHKHRNTWIFVSSTNTWVCM